MTYDRKSIAKHLQMNRRNAGFKSARAFAEYIGINPHTYTDFEQGNRPLSLETAWRFADALGCTLDQLGGREWPRADADGGVPEYIVRAYEESNEAGRFMLENQAKMILNTPEFSQGGAQPRVREGKAI